VTNTDPTKTRDFPKFDWPRITPPFIEPGLDSAALRGLIGQWREIAPNFFGDFYPLTPWTRDDTAWMAWQFDRPESSEGVVEVFRRPHSFYESARFPLRGLDDSAEYELTELCSGAVLHLKGMLLTTEGLATAINTRPGVAIWRYRRS